MALLGWSTASASDPRSIGSELWAWGWAGQQSENLTLINGPRGKLITDMVDLSGRGNHFYNYGANKPAYQIGLNLNASTKGGSYQTSLPIVGLDKYAGGSQVYGNILYQAKHLNAQGGFYLAAVCTNTRTGGERELFGTDNQNYVRLDQQRNNVTLKVGGVQQKVGKDGSLPKGILLLEIWRDDAGKVTCYGNGVDISVPRIKIPQTFALSGMGFDGGGSSQWDDYWMEFVLCDALPPQAERDFLRGYLSSKWGIPGLGGHAAPPSPSAPFVSFSPSDQAVLATPQPFFLHLSDPESDLGWLNVYFELNGDPFSRVRLPFDWFTLDMHPDGSMDVGCKYNLPTYGYVTMTFDATAIDRQDNATTARVDYHPGQ
jgi:hypothetical protein